MKNTEALLIEFKKWIREEIDSRQEIMDGFEDSTDSAISYTEVADERDTFLQVEQKFTEMFSIETADKQA